MPGFGYWSGFNFRVWVWVGKRSGYSPGFRVFDFKDLSPEASVFLMFFLHLKTSKIYTMCHTCVSDNPLSKNHISILENISL